MPPRFHATLLDEAAGRAVLGSDEAGHLARVLRLGVGAEVEVFDGRGSMYLGRVTRTARDHTEIALVSRVVPAPEPRVSVTMVISVLKGDKMDDVVRDVAMMGVSSVQPVVTARAETTVTALARGRRISRWQRIAVSSVKQCRAAVVPPIHEPALLDAWLQRPIEGPRLALIEPSAGRGELLSNVPASPVVSLLLGPEGGWTADEVAAILAAGGRAVSLGGRTLRADVAPVAALAALFEAWKGW